MTEETAIDLSTDPSFNQERGPAESGERNLWAAIIRQALVDTGDKAHHAELTRWLESWGFRRTCDILELNHEVVAREIRKRIARTARMSPSEVKAVKPRTDRRVPLEARIPEILQLRSEGKRTVDIAKIVGFSVTAVGVVFRKAS